MAAGNLRIAGIIQEQHPDRAALFMQWKQMDWPIMVDASGRLGVKVVPIHVLIDEDGIVQAINPRPDAVDAFVAEGVARRTEIATATKPSPVVAPDLAALSAAVRAAARDADAPGAEALALAEAAVDWGTAADLDGAIAALQTLVAERGDAEPGLHFRLGTLLRRRYESSASRPEDFLDAVEAWGAALAGDPNQYIWRRRVQQYGPRLDKPYPFYDWIDAARTEIRERGETPHALPNEPRGAERAAPARSFSADAGAMPPSAADVQADTEGFVDVHVVVVPNTRRPGTARVHVVLEPAAALQAKWNNEVDPVELRLMPGAELPDDLGLDARTIMGQMPEPLTAESTERRTLEFEVRLDGERTVARIPATLLYYVCEGDGGTCVYRRQDIMIDVARASVG
ncbi:MAG: TlpA family protein disulfide reductase [Phycisphaerales bacterium]